MLPLSPSAFEKRPTQKDYNRAVREDHKQPLGKLCSRLDVHQNKFITEKKKPH